MSSDTQICDLTRHPPLRGSGLRDKALPLHAQGLLKVAQGVASPFDVEGHEPCAADSAAGGSFLPSL